MQKALRVLFNVFATVPCCIASLAGEPATAKEHVHVVLWFDTEDYMQAKAQAWTLKPAILHPGPVSTEQ